MKRKLIFLQFVLFILVSLQGCSNNTPAQKSASTLKKQQFRIFLAKFKFLQLPLNIKSGDVSGGSSEKLNNKDNVFIKSEFPDEIYAYGMLPDTADNYKIVWLAPAEEEVPVLTTFTKQGKKISQVYLGVGQCGSDCGFSCTETIKLKKDLSIFSADSIEYNNCDTNGNETGKIEKYVLYKTGRILGSGKIAMSGVLKRYIK